MATHANGAGPSRIKRNAMPEEDARNLKFGTFEGVETLTPTDVLTVLEATRNNVAGIPPPDNKVYKATIEHAKEFSNASAELNAAIRETINNASAELPLNAFENAQITYLRPENVDVAYALIPSLDRFKDTDMDRRLQDLLDEVRTAVKYGGQR